MRPLPILLVVLMLAVGIGLGIRVLSTSAVPRASAVTSEASHGVPQGHVYTGVANEPEDLNPLTAERGVATRLLLAFTHDTLLDLDPATGALRPALARQFELAADGMSGTFTLRDDVTFADGAPLTMADVLFPWQLAKAGHLPLGAVNDAMARIADVEVLDDDHFRVHFRDVYYAVAEAVGVSWVVVQRKFFVDRVAASKDADEAMPAIESARFATLLDRIDDQCGPGTGPYQFDPEHGHGHWSPHQEIQIVRNDRCWRRQLSPGTWNFDGMRVLFRDQAGANNALFRGELDWYSNPNLDEMLAAHPELAKDYRALRYDYRQLGVFRVAWNCTRPPCDDVRVRRALALLFDIKSLIEVAGGNATSAVAHAKPDSPEYPRELTPFGFDPAAARRQLRELGFDAAQGHPLHLVLLVPLGTEQFRRTAELFVDACNRAGVELEVHSRQWPAYVAGFDERDWDGVLIQQSFRDWGDPYDILHSNGLWNTGKWSNAEADRLATAARTELDAGKRAALLHELHVLAYREQPAALLVHPMASILVNSHIENLAPGPAGLIPERAFVPIEFQRQ